MPNSRILVALDGMNFQEATRVTCILEGYVAGTKVNDFLDQVGVDLCKKYFGQIGEFFADPKLNDIGTTMVNRAKTYNEATYLTIHACNSIEALRTARETVPDVCVLGVTLLTSMSEEETERIYCGSPLAVVLRLADQAARAGLPGLVCSPQEVKVLHETYPDLKLVVPGVRSPGANVHDQKRTGTPAQAILDGAYRVVVGREITEKRGDPEAMRAAAMRINNDIEEALKRDL